jgi:hypothetical protein
VTLAESCAVKLSSAFFISWPETVASAAVLSVVVAST